jgi:CAAX prenyl protease-like protein
VDLAGRPWASFGGERDGYAPLLPGEGSTGCTRARRLFVLVAVVPVMEELFWRSFLMRWIDARDFLAREPGRATRAAVALSSALFAMEHSLWLAGMIAGFAYAVLYIKTNNLRAPVVAHAVDQCDSWPLDPGDGKLASLVTLSG